MIKADLYRDIALRKIQSPFLTLESLFLKYRSFFGPAFFHESLSEQVIYHMGKAHMPKLFFPVFLEYILVGYSRDNI